MSTRGCLRFATYSAIIFLFAVSAWAQQPQMSGFDRDRAQGILQVVTNDVKKHYYDPKFHGVDFDAKISDAKQKIAKETSFNMAMSHIAAALDTLNDSHTFFLPPQHAYHHTYDFQYQMIGDRCFVTQVRPGSDGDKKGLRPGDEILTINGYNVLRENLWKMQYVFTVLRPQPLLYLGLQDPAGAQRKVDVVARMRADKAVTNLTIRGGSTDIFNVIRESENAEHLMRARYVDYENQVMVLKVPVFFFSQNEVEDMIGKARKFPNLIIDLRGNPGGSVDTLRYLVGGMFDHEVKMADRMGRKATKPELAKPMHNPYTGKLAVLVDSKSASAAELFARIMQLEKRGIVVGDRSSGSVMEARRYEEKMGDETVIFYGAEITEWDLIMTDGKSLEHLGVNPDEIALPTGKDLASGRDPVLARASEMLGVQISPQAAGKAFPYEWPPD